MSSPLSPNLCRSINTAARFRVTFGVGRDANQKVGISYLDYKRDDDWVPVIKTLRRDASLRGIVLFCNQGIFYD